MSLRPLPARWFEMLAGRSDAALSLEALARTGAVELEVRLAGEAFSLLQELGAPLEEFKQLTRHYKPYWPHAGLHPSPRHVPLHAALAQAMQQLRAWQREADPLIHKLQAAQNEQTDLAVWRRLFTCLKESALDFSLLATAGPLLSARIFILPADAPALTLPERAIALRFGAGGQRCLLAVSPAEGMGDLTRQATMAKGRCLNPARWVRVKARDNLAAIETRQAELEQEVARLESALGALAVKYNLLRALGDVNRLEWLAEEVQSLPATENFVFVTGWTSDFTGDRLSASLRLRRVPALVHFPPPPADAVPPLLLHNPWWARPFELFARALGTPAGYEADPSRLLALIAPLLFGYMFGDVGQGFLIALAGWFLRRRLPAARLLIAGGASAMVFGWLFGSAFSRDDLVSALWLNPMQAPLTVLAVPLFGGALLLMLGLGLNAAEAHWRRPGRWPAETGLLPLYAGLGAAFLYPQAAWIALAGACWFLAGRVRQQPGWRSLAAGLGELLEQTFQLAINTLSFARVGASALAHAGLSQAIAVAADAVPGSTASLVIQLLGNAVVISLEALVVSVQTTRLVLFEFFVRFLRGEGRPFRPLPTPPVSL
jgi:V/A-type H+-transporting ATPase subunit I